MSIWNTSFSHTLTHTYTQPTNTQKTKQTARTQRTQQNALSVFFWSYQIFINANIFLRIAFSIIFSWNTSHNTIPCVNHTTYERDLIAAVLLRSRHIAARICFHCCCWWVCAAFNNEQHMELCTDWWQHTKPPSVYTVSLWFIFIFCFIRLSSCNFTPLPFAFDRLPLEEFLTNNRKKKSLLGVFKLIILNHSEQFSFTIHKFFLVAATIITHTQQTNKQNNNKKALLQMNTQKKKSVLRAFTHKHTYRRSAFNTLFALFVSPFPAQLYTYDICMFLLFFVCDTEPKCTCQNQFWESNTKHTHRER